MFNNPPKKVPGCVRILCVHVSTIAQGPEMSILRSNAPRNYQDCGVSWLPWPRDMVGFSDTILTHQQKFAAFRPEQIRARKAANSQNRSLPTQAKGN